MYNSSIPIINSLTSAKAHLKEKTNKFLKQYEDLKEERQLNIYKNLFPRKLVLDKEGNILSLKSIKNEIFEKIQIKKFSNDLKNSSIFNIPNPTPDLFKHGSITSLKQDPVTKICFTHEHPNLIYLNLEKSQIKISFYNKIPNFWIYQICGIIKNEAVCVISGKKISKLDSKGRHHPILTWNNHNISCSHLGGSLFEILKSKKKQILHLRAKKILLRRKEEVQPNITNPLQNGYCFLIGKSETEEHTITLRKVLSRGKEKDCIIKLETEIKHHSVALFTYEKDRATLYPKIIFLSILIIQDDKSPYCLINKISTKEMKILFEYKIETCLFPNVISPFGPVSVICKKIREEITHLYVYFLGNFTLELLELETDTILNRRQLYEKLPGTEPIFRPELNFFVVKNELGFIKIFSIWSGELLHVIKFSDLIDKNDYFDRPFQRRPIRIITNNHFVTVTNKNQKLEKFKIGERFPEQQWSSERKISKIFSFGTEHKKRIITIYENNIVSLLDFELIFITELNFNPEDQTRVWTIPKFFYILDLDLIAVYCIAEDENGNDFCNLAVYSGENYQKKEKEIIFGSFYEPKLFFAKENKVLFCTVISEHILYGIDLKNNNKIEINTELNSNARIRLLFENEKKLVLGKVYSGERYELDLSTEEMVAIGETEMKYEIGAAYVPEKKVAIIYDINNQTLVFFNTKNGIKENEKKLGNLLSYKNQEGNELKQWVKEWSSLSHLKDEIYSRINFVTSIAFFNRIDILRLVLEVFGYPIFSPEEAETKDPYILVRNNGEVDDQIKDLLKQYLLKSKRGEVYRRSGKKVDLEID